MKNNRNSRHFTEWSISIVGVYLFIKYLMVKSSVFAYDFYFSLALILIAISADLIILYKNKTK
ncbi:hypothetical protein EDL99_00290 [Ornithobacterium rhinotracheale]|uniref:hypothetical protein n=1 Tax=Ornithobacterium rhinotracheale TaxID=28251 RepID=UPI00129D0D60|nr:hypothetical protein [Ornithobacterium rhinotracheale]MRJ07323.1 hypothetical protein [Ornithobacterium rhinotracheale]UOH77924.1 hypothetical protein MT996_00290 [Ornithobacterium rhinotracheale]